MFCLLGVEDRWSTVQSEYYLPVLPIWLLIYNKVLPYFTYIWKIFFALHAYVLRGIGLCILLHRIPLHSPVCISYHTFKTWFLEQTICLCDINRYSLFIYLIYFCVAGEQTQSFMHARQTFNNLATSSALNRYTLWSLLHNPFPIGPISTSPFLAIFFH
jgi:hypothetical protein